MQRLLCFVLLVCAWKLCTAQNEPPFFQPDRNTIAIQEMEQADPTFQIYDVNATDTDGDNITYSIPPNSVNSDKFRVDNVTGKVFTFPDVVLDRERLPSTIDLFIEAQDGFDHEELLPPFQLSIILHDVNDNHPSILSSFPTTITIPEDTPLNSELLTVEATDADSGINARVVYFLLEESTLFSVDYETGELTLTGDLDYDNPSTRSHSITIIAEDRGSPRLQDAETLTVVVSDVDDLNPVFEPSSYSVSIYENTTRGRVIERVMAMDGDRGVDDEIFYRLEDAGNSLIDGDLSFIIDPESGELSVNVTSLDRELHSLYSLTVKALQVNDTSKFATATVDITILDNNDNLPIFDPANYSADVSELEEIGHTVLTVTVDDEDIGPNSEFTLLLEDLRNSTSSLPFSISSSGVITLNSVLDFEEIEYYLFRVIAEEESGANGTALVRVNVVNRNDHHPMFNPLLYYSNISEGVTPGAFIELITARDEDSGIFGELTYSLTSGHSDDFYINTTSSGGAVFTETRLDYEERTSYSISIQAADTPEDGMPSNIARMQAQLMVEVININDNPPKFDRDSLTVQLDEEAAEGTVVATLMVTDRDGEDFTDRSFSITAGNDDGNFTFDPVFENVVVTSEELDYDLYPGLREQTLTIIVNDTAFTDEMTLTILLQDINDNTPMFDNSSYQFEIYEEVPTESVIGTVSARDDDSGDLGRVMYSISDNDQFAINSTTGVITTKAGLNREDEDTYSVTVTATDQDPDEDKRRSQAVQVTITVLDINDNSPEFTEEQYEVPIEENTDTIDFSVTATDGDVGTNAEIVYEFINGNTNNAFVIDPETGRVNRNASVPLDREEVAAYVITVLATDGGDPSNNATATIDITILDKNDKEPMFNPSSINTSVDEDIRGQMLVLRATATDEDTPPNANLQYSISVAGPPEPDPTSSDPAPPTGTFVIDEFLGDIRTQGMFDREAFEGPYVLQVVVSDNGVGGTLFGTAEVTVYLTDVNDNDPIFRPTTYSMSLNEELPPSQPITTVMATDLDAGSNRELSFSISSVVALNNIDDQAAVADHFTVNATTGLVETGVSLDYEFVQRYRITVTATDGGDNQRASSASITMTVLDVNDHTPQFSSDRYTLSISEETLRNMRFPLLRATDRDSGENGRLTYTANITSPFRVDSATGEIVVTETLDYEAGDTYSFTVNVTDNGGSDTRMNYTTVTVVLEDENDNPPIFQNDSYYVTIREADYTNAVIITTVEAKDLDSGSFGEVRYNMLPESSGLFSLNNMTGVVSVVAKVDFEALNPPLDATEITLQLIIQASDGGIPAMTSTVTVTVTITDENDNAPIFEGTPYTSTLRENTAPGVEVIVVRATDKDGNRNGVVRYSISDTDNFSIDEVTGIITTGTANDSSSTLLYDYDNGPREYIFTVYATDNGTSERSSMTDVIVAILDANDNSPVITSVTPRSVTVPEDASVNYVLPVEIVVTDPDSGENSEVDYQLSNDGGLFVVNISTSGGGVEVSLGGKLDREAVEDYNITITVTDRGQPRKSVESYFLVKVDDINDNPPLFEQDTYTTVLPEDARGGDQVGPVIMVVDRDSRERGGGRLEFMLSGDSQPFTLDFTALADGWWELIVKTVGDELFDYEDGPRSYDLVIEARDVVTPVMYGNTSLAITILDVNDEPPTFSSPSYSLSLPENLPQGGAVGSVLATDPDGANNGRVSYSFAEGTANSITSTFSLDAMTGVILLEGAIDFESGVMSYDFVVVARDGGTPARSSTASVRVDIEDINEFAPQFTQDLYTKTIPENEDRRIVLTVSANDSEPQSAITYGIVAGSMAAFELDPQSGVLSTQGPLDREAVAQYVLTLQAVDGDGASGRTSYTQVIVTVGDMNDETPSFPLNSYTYNVQEGFSATITPPTATDPDLGNNAVIRYSLQPPTSASQPFQVDPTTAEITLAQSLDREMVSSYTLQLLAADGGSPSRVGFTQLRILVTDINDRSPEFEQTSYSTTIAENSPDGVSVIRVTATDEDDMDLLAYSIIDGDPAGQFRIDHLSGLISTTVVSLDREVEEEYTLRVRVTDIGERTDEVDVVVTVEDRNDNPPRFTSDTYSGMFEEDNIFDLEVAVVTATDIDEGSNGDVVYSISGGNSDDIFYIIPSSGQVIARPRGLNYEARRVHTLTIEATDQATPANLQRFSTAVVTVTVEDTNDNRPVFSQNEYRTTLVENAQLGTTVIVISATDGDSGSNGQIVYSFGTTSSSVFSINATTGVVTVTGSVNFEMGQEHELSVEASDRGNPRRSQVAALHVLIRNEEDESPRFPISFYTASINEDEPRMTSVLTVTATDPDGSDSLVYDIISAASTAGSSYFLIDPNSGEISTAGTLDREAVAVVNLQVIATDRASNNGTAIVQITVTDINDNAPKFLADSYTASLRENSAVGTTIIPFVEGNSTRVEAIDADGPGLNSEVSYDKGGEDGDKFSVDFRTGIVTVAPGAVLNREEDPTLEITITALDRGDPVMSTSVTMTITLLDENDNHPTFVPTNGYTVVVPEDIAVGSVLTTVVATDPDLEGGGDIYFTRTTAVPLTKLSCFSVNSTTGAITLEDKLDREEDPLISLVISAHDSGEPSLVTTTTVRIAVTDVNDNRPEFLQDTYIASVSEQYTVGASFLTVSAEDPDSGTNGQVEYNVASSDTPFTIHPDSGDLSTRVPLDYEAQRRHDIIVQACDKAPDQNCSTASVIVHVIDFNDAPPLFDFSTYSTDICQSQSQGEVFIQPAATDRDSGNNSKLTYSLSDESVMGVWPDTGRVYLVRGVASEEVGSIFTTVITARDGTSPMLSGTADIMIRVVNCTDDNFRFIIPFFEAETTEVAGGNGVILVSSINTFPSPAVTVVFNPPLEDNPFALHPNLLTVQNRSLLDRETRDRYTLPIMATSSQGETAYATITVTVLDVNDNPPQLMLRDLSFTVPENTTAPVSVTTVMATDDDIGVNADIQFMFTVSSDYFRIDGTTGEVFTTSELDREEDTEHQLTIRATDGGTPDLQSEAITITVTVSDKNDNAPAFSEDVYTVEVVENTPPGTSVLTVEATDRDIGQNAAISFLVVDGDTNILTLNSETGVVRTLTALNYEVEQQYSLTVVAADDGAPVMSSTVQINVTVLDFNDHTPVFVNPVTSVPILEGVAIGTVLTEFNVIDGDSGDFGADGVRFSIVAGNTALFSVNSVSGILTTEAMLDRDVGPECYFLSVQARDSAGEHSLANVTEISVCLIDENDNCPNFTRPSFSGELLEDEDINQQLLLRVQATDADSEDGNDEVVYSLLEDGGVFEVDSSTGFLSLTATLDTESTPRYELVVEACDRGTERCCTNTTITVDILDVNDNKPIIQNIRPEDCISILETNDTYSCGGSVHEVGDVVFTVNATDRDSGANGAVLYELVGESTSFHVSAGGVVTIADNLDYELQQTYQLYLSALDQGMPLSLTSDIRILCVNIEDINDRAPEFSVDSNQYNVAQDEEIVPESAILHIVATDGDAGDNAVVSYSITSGNTTLFRINEDTGQLYLQEALDCETTSSYTLTVTANNSLSSCPLSASVDVVISVNDINDNRPAFSQDVYNATVNESIAISSPLLDVVATDDDKNSPNNDLLYSLQLSSGANPFHLDQVSGLLTVQNPLDAESLQPDLNYTLTVLVADRGVPEMTDTATVIIFVRDVNDQPPTFTQDTYNVEVIEEMPASFSLVSLNFTDSDIHQENRDSTVTIASVTGRSPDGTSRDLGAGLGLFSVGSNNSLELTHIPDRENISSYDITLSVDNNATCYQTDGDCSGSAEVVVTVADVNDNRPRFISQLYSGEVSVTASTGTSVLTVQATDEDSGNYGEVEYRIEDSLDGRFRVDEKSGVILTRGSFDNLDGQRLSLRVVAYDNPGGTPSLSSTATVNVVILNDFQRISVLFSCGIDTIVRHEDTIINIIANVSGLDIQVENYADHSDDIASNFIFHATDPVTNEIVDFDEFFERLQASGDQSKDAELINRLSDICRVEKITAFANIDEYEYPSALDTQTVIIFVLCVFLLAGAVTSLVMAIQQRWVALHDTRSKLLADVFYGSPGSTSLIENVQHENYQLEEMGSSNRQNPMFVQPYDNWQGVDASGPESTGDVSSMNRDNPLYESQEIRMEMFADVSEEEEGDEADDAELLAAALKEDDEPEDNSVTAI